MKTNIGKIDKAIRIVLGLAIAFAGYYFKSWWGLVALVPLLTAFVGMCSVYSLLGINTCSTGVPHEIR